LQIGFGGGGIVAKMLPGSMNEWANKLRKYLMMKEAKMVDESRMM
jgi:hypothetical protein